MQEIIVDYVPNESMKLTLLLVNAFYSWVVGLIAAFAILKMSFGV